MSLSAIRTDPGPDSIYIGTMSGTSMDGLDLVAVSFAQSSPHETLATSFTPYPSSLKQRLQTLAWNEQASVNQMCQLDSELGQFYAQEVINFIQKYGLSTQSISAIGLHGQTIRHSVQGPHPYTLQIGDANIVAARTGITVVADFRRKDVALKGQGAPLAPAFHNQVFRSTAVNRAIINIGGIANITFLPADPTKQTVGFDSGPGNTLMDHFCQLKFNCEYDEDGHLASQGKIHPEKIQQVINNEPYFQLPFPKSTGTDYFSPQWLESTGLLELPPKDAITCLAQLTSRSIALALQSVDIEIEEYYLCGGGAHNKYLQQSLQDLLQSNHVHTTEKLGIHPDWVEASAFAWLANQTLQQKPGNLPSVTNAEKFTILGAVYF